MKYTTTLWLLVLAAVASGSSLARGPWRADGGNTQGWQLMSPEERIAHQAKMRSFENYEECSRYQLEHQRLMEARAAQQGVQLRHGRRDVCAELYWHTPGS